MKPLEIIEQGRFLGEEMLAWLWWRGLAESGTSGVEGDTTSCFVDDAVQLVCSHGDVHDLSLKKGNPAESREAFQALGRGMRSYKAKLRLLSGDLEWVFTLSSATLTLSGMKMPPSQAKSPQDRLADRIFLAEELIAHFDRRYRQFLQERMESPEKMLETLKKWIKEGVRGVCLEEGDED